jgi:hypothetical protein
MKKTRIAESPTRYEAKTRFLTLVREGAIDPPRF